MKGLNLRHQNLLPFCPESECNNQNGNFDPQDLAKFSGGSWWKWPGGLRNFISGWTYRIVALPLAVYNGVSSHSSSPKLIKLVIFSCPYWYIQNIHFSLIKANPNPKHEHKRINPTGPIKSMTHNQCHQSCKGESRTQDHSHTKLGIFRSTTKVVY